MQPPQHLHPPRGRRPRCLDIAVSRQRILDRAHSEPTSIGMERQEVWTNTNAQHGVLGADNGRIFENQHLLDATEIFRKLNVHKKVRLKMKNALSLLEGGII